MTRSKQSDNSRKNTVDGKISRREVLQKSAASCAFFIFPSSVISGLGRVVPSEKTTLACIGTGGRGSQNIRTFLRFDEIQIVAVCDVERENDRYISWDWEQGKEKRICGREPARRTVDAFYAEQKMMEHYRSCRAYADYRELLEKEDVDAVMIATPDHTHAVITMAALKQGKHVYCEKPLTWSVKEARMIAGRRNVREWLRNWGIRDGQRKGPGDP